MHHGLIVYNDDFLPEKLSICMKFSKPFDKEQEVDANHLKIWSGIRSIASQFPRFIIFSKAKKINGVAKVKVDPKDPNRGVRSVLLCEAMGEGKTVGMEMKAIYEDPKRRETREMFVLCVRFMMWGFELQKEHCKAQSGHLQDMHPENCVFMRGVPATNMPEDFLHGRAGKYTLFLCIDLVAS